ncbi:MAG: electron transport complex subunit RsxC [Deltaproteobacteria bacterium]|nr:electron transport complex subunit RsxC [Deltaproteobacteria bacterium]
MADIPVLRHLSPVRSFPHGIHPPEEKDATRSLPIRRFPFAPFLVLLLSQHAGRPARPVVREGQEVARGQPVAEADGFVSVPIHAPASGIIRKVGHALDMDGRMAPAIVLEPYPGSDQLVAWGKDRDPDSMSPREIVGAIRDMGMVGLGGAAFPAHVKFTPPEGRVIDTLIINAAECEPYLTADHRVMLEMPEKVLLGTSLIQKALKASRALIAIEDNKPDAIARMREALAEFQSGNGAGNMEVRVCRTKYPQGAEKMLTKALLNREIPSGGLPADIGVMVSNVTTASEIGTLLPRGQGLIERVITITGRGVERPGNYLMPIGTPLSFILEQVGMKGQAREVLFGGPMMGKAVAFVETPITKGISGIVVMEEEELPRKSRVYPCIRCGECINVCPMYLNPSTLGQLARKNRFDEMAESLNLFDCFECGCCSYVCPANIPLVQSFRLSKAVVRERMAAK